MLTSNQRDILAALFTYDFVARTDDLFLPEIIEIYKTNRQWIEDYDIQCAKNEDDLGGSDKNKGVLGE